MTINIATVALALAAFIFITPWTLIGIGFLGCCIWCFVDRGKALPENPVYEMFSNMLPKMTSIVEHKGLYYIKRLGSYQCYSDKKWYEHVRYCVGADRREFLEPDLFAARAPVLFLTFFTALFVAAIGVCLQIFFWGTIYVASCIGFVFALRWMRDIQKYARKVMTKLDAHKEDPEAHKVHS